MGHLLFDHLCTVIGGEGDVSERRAPVPPHCGKPETANCTRRTAVDNYGSKGGEEDDFIYGIGINESRGIL